MEELQLDAQCESGRSSPRSSHCDHPTRSRTAPPTLQDNTAASEIGPHSTDEKKKLSVRGRLYGEKKRWRKNLEEKTRTWYGICQVDQKTSLPHSAQFLFRHPKLRTPLNRRNVAFSLQFLKVSLPSFLSLLCWQWGKGSLSEGS